MQGPCKRHAEFIMPSKSLRISPLNKKIKYRTSHHPLHMLSSRPIQKPPASPIVSKKEIIHQNTFHETLNQYEARPVYPHDPALDYRWAGSSS